MNRVAAVLSLLIVTCLLPRLAAAAESKAWVKQSDENAQIALAVFARYYPEYAGQTGIAGIDENILDLQSRRLRSLPGRQVARGGTSPDAIPGCGRSARVRQDLWRSSLAGC